METQREYINEILDGVGSDILREAKHIIFAKSRVTEDCVEVKFDGETGATARIYRGKVSAFISPENLKHQYWDK